MATKNYKPVIYSTAIELPGSQTEVFDRLIDLKKWWPEDFEGEDIKLHSEFVFTTGDSHYSKNKVIEFVPGKKLSWLVVESLRKTDGYDWTGTKMIFALTSKGDHTMLQFHYDGVVPENELERLDRVCDMTVKEMFYNYIVNGKGK